MMKIRRLIKGPKRENQKGLIGFVMMLLFSIFSIVFAALLPEIVLTRYYTETISFELHYNAAQRALQTMSSMTQESSGIYGDGGEKRGSKIIGEYLKSRSDADAIEFMKDELDRMVDWKIFNCYKLTDQNGRTIVERECKEGLFGGNRHEAEKFRTTMPITTPSGVEMVTLVVQ